MQIEGPRSPAESELEQVIAFLDKSLRPEANWSIASEYPTTINRLNLNNMRVIFNEQNQVVSHAAVKPLLIRTPQLNIKVAAIGSVVTDSSNRNQGFSRKVIEDCLDIARAQDCDVAILWSNLFDFYKKLGFELAGSEVLLSLDEPFSVSTQGVRFMDSTKVDPLAILRLYKTHTVQAHRTEQDIIEFLKIPQTRLFTAWDNENRCLAFAVEGKGADLQGYIHEWAGGVSHLIPLLAFARKSLNKPMVVLSPKHATNFLQKIEPFCTGRVDGHLGMIKLLNKERLLKKVFPESFDRYLTKPDSEMTQLLFGPISNQQAKIPFWIWGWDSI